MNLNLTSPLAFVDLETTGTDFSRDRIVEIAVIKVYPDGEIIEKCDRINPGVPIPAGATAIHGISDLDVKDCPLFSKLALAYADFLTDADLAGFNSNRFDFPFLNEEFLRAGVQVDFASKKFIDVQRIFHLMEPRNLEAAYKMYCGKKLEGAHGAAADARATFEVLKAQLDYYPEKLQNDTAFLHAMSSDGQYADMGRRMLIENGIEKFNFGKHKGKPVTEVFKAEPNYYDWIMKSDFPLDFKEKLKAIKMKMTGKI